MITSLTSVLIMVGLIKIFTAMRKGIAIFSVLGVCAIAAVVYQNHLNNTCELSAANAEPEPDMILQEPMEEPVEEESLSGDQLFSSIINSASAVDAQQLYFFE